MDLQVGIGAKGLALVIMNNKLINVKLHYWLFSAYILEENFFLLLNISGYNLFQKSFSSFELLVIQNKETLVSSRDK
jgi:hypothetical protein